MTLFDRLKVGMFGCQNDTTTNFQQRQTYNLSFHVNKITTPRVSIRFTSIETDPENLDFHESLSTAFLLTLFGKNFENFEFFKISKPPVTFAPLLGYLTTIVNETSKEAIK